MTVQECRPVCKTTFYNDPYHPNSTNQQVFLHCYNIGCDGRSLDQVMKQTAYVDSQNNIFAFDDLANKITRIFVQNNGNVIISQNGLACCPNLQELDIGCNMNNYCWNLNLPPNEFSNTPRLQSLSLRTVALPSDSLSALSNLKNRLESIRLRNVEPGLKLVKILESFTNLKHVYIKNLCKDISFPTSIFRGSASHLTWITLDGCNLPKISSDMFRGMEKLLKLELFNSNIETVEPNSFDDLADLRELSLTCNKISALPKGLFRNLMQMTHVDLSGNEIEPGSISRHNFDHCEHLVRLEM